MVGGCAGLVGAILVGPRKFMDDGMGGYKPRFEADGSVNAPAMSSSSLPFSALGTLILWVGWYGFNPGSEFAITGSSLDTVGLVTVNTTLGAAASAFTYFLISFVLAEPDLTGILNSALGGLVSVTANCNVVEPWAAAFIGMIGAFVYLGSSYCLKKLQVDDVIDASPVHYFCGIWGVLATGLFASDRVMALTLTGHDAGVFYGGGVMFGWQIAGIVAITAWTSVVTLAFLAPMHYFGMLRISEEEEKLGLDAYLASKGHVSISTPKSSSKTTLKADLETGAVVNLEVIDEPTVGVGTSNMNPFPATVDPALSSPDAREKSSRGCISGNGC
jgi:Amt family ammonium transporter